MVDFELWSISYKKLFDVKDNKLVLAWIALEIIFVDAWSGIEFVTTNFLQAFDMIDDRQWSPTLYETERSCGLQQDYSEESSSNKVVPNRTNLQNPCPSK